MIKFFRKIRHRLLIENKFSKYLLYAIGEIVLVVFGILIALQINNWNEERKQKILEVKFLERLVVDLAIDTTYYIKRISSNAEALVWLKSYLNESYQTQENAKEAKILLKKAGVNTDDLVTHNSTYLELMSTGNLSIIENEILKGSITSYYRLNDELASNIHEFNGTSTNLLVEAIKSTPWMKYYVEFHEDPNIYRDSDWQFLNDPSSEKFQILEAMALIFLIRTEEHKGYLERLNDSSNKLISLINAELKK